MTTDRTSGISENMGKEVIFDRIFLPGNKLSEYRHPGLPLRAKTGLTENESERRTKSIILMNQIKVIIYYNVICINLCVILVNIQ